MGAFAVCLCACVLGARYTAQCLRLLVEYLVRSAGAVVGQAANALHSRASHSATTGGGPAAGTPDKPLDTAAAAMTIVLSLLSSSLFRKQVRGSLLC